MAGEKAAREAGEAFWRFSLAFYARPGIAAALIALQDRAGLDVNLILFGLWLGGVRGQTLDTTALAAAEAASAPLRDAVIADLRTLRRRLRGDPDPDIQALRRRVQALEIAAERRAQYRLAATAPAGGAPRPNRAAVAAANLALCLGGEVASAEAAALRAEIERVIRRA